MGGIGVMVGIAVSVPLVSPSEWWPLWLAVSLLVAISFVDDLVGLPILGRLLVHFVAAGGLVYGLLGSSLGNGAAALAILAIVWMINLFNFMDGMDGLAGGMAIFGFGFLAIGAWLSGNGPIALVNASIAAAAGGFLLFNFPPARIFLGDTGSTALGFLAAGLGLIGWRDGTWSLWFPVLIFSPFIVDATVTLVRRGVQRERLWQAHRAHYYQRLVLSGWGHRKTVLAEYGLMVLCGILASSYHMATDSARLAILLLWGLLMGSVMLAVRVAERTAARLKSHG
jgi:UDP-GlcNAc:undecaprenyl-phosphate/decaprenyl-phosphate GlcNAc-1-phosphate transferase